MRTCEIRGRLKTFHPGRNFENRTTVAITAYEALDLDIIFDFLSFHALPTFEREVQRAAVSPTKMKVKRTYHLYTYPRG